MFPIWRKPARSSALILSSASFSHELVPLDYKTFFDSRCAFTGGIDLETGRAVYFEKAEMDELLTPVGPLLYPDGFPRCGIKDHFLLDGGVRRPIPIARSIEDGNNLQRHYSDAGDISPQASRRVPARSAAGLFGVTRIY